jgi:phosphomannomutase / phosphoglucomutase
VRFASSNKRELVVVESPASEARMGEMFKSVDALLRTHKEVGEYNPMI